MVKKNYFYCGKVKKNKLIFNKINMKDIFELIVLWLLAILWIAVITFIVIVFPVWIVWNIIWWCFGFTFTMKYALWTSIILLLIYPPKITDETIINK